MAIASPKPKRERVKSKREYAYPYPQHPASLPSTPNIFWDEESTKWCVEAGDFIERFNSYQDALVALNASTSVELANTF
jgi:hypothetical protein